MNWRPSRRRGRAGPQRRSWPDGRHPGRAGWRGPTAGLRCSALRPVASRRPGPGARPRRLGDRSWPGPGRGRSARSRRTGSPPRSSGSCRPPPRTGRHRTGPAPGPPGRCARPARPSRRAAGPAPRPPDCRWREVPGRAGTRRAHLLREAPGQRSFPPDGNHRSPLILLPPPGPGPWLAPFRGIRSARDRVSGIANVTSPPYDVISEGILEYLRAADPHNVVRLILPGEDADASRVAASLLREWLSAGVLIRDRTPALYLYEQADEASSWIQRGIISLVRLGPPETAGILPHEGVMPGLVADRKTLMAATRANLEPIFLIYDGEGAGPVADEAVEAVPTATEIIDHVAAEHTPIVSITTEDGVNHRLWRVGQPHEQAAILSH